MEDREVLGRTGELVDEEHEPSLLIASLGSLFFRSETQQAKEGPANQKQPFCR